MSSSGDDLDWLYGRERQQSEPERTRVMPLLVRTVLLAVAAILLVYAVLPALLRMV